MSTAFPVVMLTPEQYNALQQKMAAFMAQQLAEMTLSAKTMSSASSDVVSCVGSTDSASVMSEPAPEHEEVSAPATTSAAASAAASEAAPVETSAAVDGMSYWLDNQDGLRHVPHNGKPVRVVCDEAIVPFMTKNLHGGIKAILLTLSQMATLHDNRTFIQIYTKPLDDITSPILRLSEEFEGEKISIVFWNSNQRLDTGLHDHKGAWVSPRRTSVYSICGKVLPSRVVYRALLKALQADC